MERGVAERDVFRVAGDEPVPTPIHRDARQRPCPVCGHLTHRIHRTFGDRFISLFGRRKRLRCRRCGWTRLVRDHDAALAIDSRSALLGALVILTLVMLAVALLLLVVQR